LREHMLDFHKTKPLPVPRKINIAQCQKRLFTWVLGTFWHRSTKYGACHSKWPPKPHLILTNACQRFSNVQKDQKVPRLPRMKSARCPALVMHIGVLDFNMSWKIHACHTEWT
jgi:hypothetical protein